MGGVVDEGKRLTERVESGGVEIFAAKRQTETGEADEDRILRGRHRERLLGEGR
jgi:hypothetical protein